MASSNINNQAIRTQSSFGIKPQAAKTDGSRAIGDADKAKISSATDSLQKSVDGDNPITQGPLQDAIKDLGLSPELQKSIVGLAPADNAATQGSAAADQIAATTAQSKSAGFDTGFGLYGANKGNDIKNQVDESSAKLDDWQNTGASLS